MEKRSRHGRMGVEDRKGEQRRKGKVEGRGGMEKGNGEARGEWEKGEGIEGRKRKRERGERGGMAVVKGG